MTGAKRADQTIRTDMHDALKILLVDDNEDDRALAARELGRNFLECEFHHVIDSSQFARALESGPWDLIVTDYQLRWSEGLSVLAAVKAHAPECPVIMFTGSGSEEIRCRSSLTDPLWPHCVMTRRELEQLPHTAHY